MLNALRVAARLTQGEAAKGDRSITVFDCQVGSGRQITQNYYPSKDREGLQMFDRRCCPNLDKRGKNDDKLTAALKGFRKRPKGLTQQDSAVRPGFTRGMVGQV